MAYLNLKHDMKSTIPTRSRIFTNLDYYFRMFKQTKTPFCKIVLKWSVLKITYYKCVLPYVVENINTLFCHKYYYVILIF